MLVVSPDRTTEYACGSTIGALDALQVLDRWRFVRNLREALERLLDRVHRRLAVLPSADQLSSDPTALLYVAHSAVPPTTRSPDRSVGHAALQATESTGAL